MSATTISTPSAFLAAAACTFKRAAQRHELRILLDVGDQIEHVGGGVADAPLGRELRHRAS